MNSELLEKFNEIQKIVINSKDEEYDDYIKLDFYKYYKQATIGDCNTDKPWFYEQLKSMKWTAWDNIRGMTKEDAMNNYISLYNDVKK